MDWLRTPKWKLLGQPGKMAGWLGRAESRCKSASYDFFSAACAAEQGCRRDQGSATTECGTVLTAALYCAEFALHRKGVVI